MARDLMLTAAASESAESGSHEYATRFEDGSDEIIILKKRPVQKTDDKIRIDWKETRGFDGSETLYLENILESINSVVKAFDGQEEPAEIKWDEYNKAAFLTGTENGLLLLARELIRFALSATSGDKCEVKVLQYGSGRLVLVLSDNY
jgi:hypothetical protein